MINGRKLNENISPNQRRLRLKELSGQKLTEKEKQTLLRKESVSMVQPSKYHDRTSPTGRLLKTWGNSDEDLDQEIDLEEILREMGYEGEEETEDELSDEEYQQVMKDLGLDEEEDEDFLTEYELQEIIDELEREL